VIKIEMQYEELTQDPKKPPKWKTSFSCVVTAVRESSAGLLHLALTRLLASDKKLYQRVLSVNRTSSNLWENE